MYARSAVWNFLWYKQVLKVSAFWFLGYLEVGFPETLFQTDSREIYDYEYII